MAEGEGLVKTGSTLGLFKVKGSVLVLERYKNYFAGPPDMFSRISEEHVFISSMPGDYFVSDLDDVEVRRIGNQTIYGTGKFAIVVTPYDVMYVPNTVHTKVSDILDKGFRLEGREVLWSIGSAYYIGDNTFVEADDYWYAKYKLVEGLNGVIAYTSRSTRFITFNEFLKTLRKSRFSLYPKIKSYGYLPLVDDEFKFAGNLKNMVHFVGNVAKREYFSVELGIFVPCSSVKCGKSIIFFGKNFISKDARVCMPKFVRGDKVYILEGCFTAPKIIEMYYSGKGEFYDYVKT